METTANGKAVSEILGSVGFLFDKTTHGSKRRIMLPRDNRPDKIPDSNDFATFGVVVNTIDQKLYIHDDRTGKSFCVDLSTAKEIEISDPLGIMPGKL